MERNVEDNSSETRLLCEQSLYTLVALPIELLVYVFSFVTSARDKVKLRYVSQRLRAAVETPSLWRDFTWSHFDFREERSIKSVFKSCGGHVKRLSFPDLVIPVKLLQQCSNVVQLCLPSATLSVNQLRKVMRSIKQLQYLDISWTSRDDIKRLLLINTNLKELTIREQVQDSSFHSAFLLLLNEWAAIRLTPRTLNIVTSALASVVDVFGEWVPSRPSLANHSSYLKVYKSFEVLIGLAPTFPAFQLQFVGQHCTVPYVVARNYGLLGLDSDRLVLTDRIIGNREIYKALMVKSSGNEQVGPICIVNIEFLTHFDVAQCDTFYTGHLEQLAVACPNLQHLNLLDNVNCLKCLQGLRAIATCCQKLEGLNIVGISVKEVECCVKLWEILVDLQLTYLAIELCCLQCFVGNDQTKHTIIIGLYQKCLKMKALESYCENYCTNCIENDQPLQLSNFPSLIHCITDDIDINICEKLRYLRYTGNNISCSWTIADFNLEQLCIISDQLALPDSFMNTISAHGGLVHVILSVNFVTQTGIAALIENSPSLITCHVHIRTGAVWCILFNPKDFKSRLEKKYSHRKLFLCGSFHLVKGKICIHELRDLLRLHTVDLTSLWSY